MSLRDLRDIADLLHQRELARMAPILRDEARCRAEIARLGDMDREARSFVYRMDPFRAAGGGTLWSIWVDRRRTELEAELARILTRKAREVEDLRRAFGRVRALDDLARAADQTRRLDRRRRADASIDALVRLRQDRR